MENTRAAEKKKKKATRWMKVAEKIPQLSTGQGSDTFDGLQTDCPRLSKRLTRTGSDFLEDINHGKYDQWDPELCVQLLRLPNVQNYAGMKKWLENSDRKQIVLFLEMDGLGVLFESLEKMSERGFGSFADALLQLECVSCVRVVMNLRAGLDYITEHRDCARKLVKALDTRNTMVKKQVFELLSAISIYSENGYEVALDALQNYKVTKNLRYRFSVIMNELKTSELDAYKGTLLGFINCLIVSPDEVKVRVRIRNEFIGMGLLDILDSLRQTDNEEIYTQCNVFDRHKHSDDELAEQCGLNDDADACGLFQSVYESVRDTPQEFMLLVLLQNLSRLDPHLPESDHVWEILEEVTDSKAEKLRWRQKLMNYCNINKRDNSTQTMQARKSFSSFHGTVMTTTTTTDAIKPTKELETFNEVTPISTEPTVRIFSDRSTVNSKDTTGIRKMQDSKPDMSIKEENQEIIHPPEPGSIPKPASVTESLVQPPSITKSIPPPPPPMPGSALASPPILGSIPPPPPMLGSIPPPLPMPGSISSPPPMPGSIPPPPPMPGSIPPMPGSIPPPPPMPGSIPSPPPMPGSIPPPPPILGLIPPPMTFTTSDTSVPMKGDIGDNHSIQNHPANNIPCFRKPARTPSQRMKTLNWNKIPPNAIGDSVWGSLRLRPKERMTLDYEKVEELFGRKDAPAKVTQTVKTAKQEQKEVFLLDSRRSLSVNIFLKQFKESHATIIQMIQDGCHKFFGTEKLNGFLKILPEKDEIDIIRSYSGDLCKLGAAESFYLKLLSVDGFKQRLHCMLLQEEFVPCTEVLNNQIMLMTREANQIMNDQSLEDFLELILDMGNFLNAGSYAGNAAGFKLSSLPKLYDMRSNKPRMTLLHYLVDMTEKKDQKMLSFISHLTDLRQAAKLTIDGVDGEIRQLHSRVVSLTNQLSGFSKDVHNQYGQFLSEAKIEVEKLEKDLENVKILANQMRQHFCEEEKFQLEECFSILADFCEKIQKAKLENEQLKKMEEKAKRMKEEKEKMKTSKKNKGLIHSGSEEDSLIDMLLGEIKKGSFKLRKVRQI